MQQHFVISNIHNISFLNESVTRNELLKQIDFKRNYQSDSISPCPFQSFHLNHKDFSSNNKKDFEKLLPHGDYKYDHKVWSDDDGNILTISVYERFNTGIKQKF